MTDEELAEKFDDIVTKHLEACMAEAMGLSDEIDTDFAVKFMSALIATRAMKSHIAVLYYFSSNKSASRDVEVMEKVADLMNRHVLPSIGHAATETLQ